MLLTHDILRNRLLLKAGVIQEKSVFSYKLSDLKKSEWSPKFEQLMRNRLIMGAFRYEPFKSKQINFGYKAAEEAIVRIKRYLKDGNTEHLVDAANMCLLEFEFGKHPNKHFRSIDDGKHAEKN